MAFLLDKRAGRGDQLRSSRPIFMQFEPRKRLGKRISRPPRLHSGGFELPLIKYLGAINKEKRFPKTEQKFRKGIDKLS